MITFIQLVAIFIPSLIPVGYAVYRARRIAMRERMGRQLYTMPLAEDEPDNPFALNRRLLGFSLPETRPTMQQAGNALTHAFGYSIDFNRSVPIIQYGTPLPVAYYDHATGMVQRVDTADVKQEPLHDLAMECQMMEGI